jgi:hypothetical protein
VLGVPGSYTDWVSWLEAFGRGEDRPSGHLPVLDAKMGPHMLERLLNQVHQAFHKRQQRWGEVLRRDLKSLSHNSPDAVITVAVVLNSARKRLAPLWEFVDHPAFPEDLHKILRDGLTETVKSSQRSLEDTTRRAPFELQAAVRSNSMLAPYKPPRPRPPGSAPGRRVIL